MQSTNFSPEELHLLEGSGLGVVSGLADEDVLVLEAFWLHPEVVLHRHDAASGRKKTFAFITLLFRWTTNV